jgi:tetratricopeptide (TPR) repeat protein
MRQLILAGSIALGCTLAGAPGTPQSDAGQQKLIAAAEAAEQNGRPDEALRSYLEVLRLAPAQDSVLTKVGGLYYNRRDYASAFQYLSRAHTANPGNFYAVKFAGMACFQLRKYEQALELLSRAAVLQKRDAEVHHWLGLTHYAASRPRKAIDELYAAVDINPKDAESLYMLGKIHWELSQQAWGEMNKADPGSYRVHALRGEGNLLANRTEEALREYLIVVEKAPDVPGFHEILGRLYLQKNELDQAARYFNEELKLAPDNSPFSYLGLAQIEFQQQNHQRALDVLMPALRQKPDFGQAYLLAGKVYRALNDNAKALEALERAARLLPTDATPHYMLMQIYEDLGNSEAAARARDNFERLRSRPKPIQPANEFAK